jgi:hypothetical protein
MSRVSFVTTASGKFASHPDAGRAQWIVGSIDEDGISNVRVCPLLPQLVANNKTPVAAIRVRTARSYCRCRPSPALRRSDGSY